MTILYKLDPRGGFTCGDTETGRTAYAYATSRHAVAARKAPEQVAAKMMTAENKCGAWRDARGFKAQDAKRLASLI